MVGLDFKMLNLDYVGVIRLDPNLIQLNRCSILLKVIKFWPCS